LRRQRDWRGALEAPDRPAEGFRHAVEHGPEPLLGCAKLALGGQAASGLYPPLKARPPDSPSSPQDRRIIEVHGDSLGPAVTVEHEFLVVEGQGAAGQADLHDMIVEVSHLRPAFADRHSKLLRMLTACKDRISIIVEHDALFTPKHDHRHGGTQDQAGRGLEALGPVGDGPRVADQSLCLIKAPHSPPPSRMQALRRSLDEGSVAEKHLSGHFAIA
jgi:hypothetical protein